MERLLLEELYSDVTGSSSDWLKSLLRSVVVSWNEDWSGTSCDRQSTEDGGRSLTELLEAVVVDGRGERSKVTQLLQVQLEVVNRQTCKASVRH